MAAEGGGAERDTRAMRAAGWYVLLGALAVLVLFPVYLTVVRALSEPGEYASRRFPLTPVAIDWDVFSRAWTRGGMGSAIARNAVVTALTVIAQVVTSALAAYAFVFLRFPFKRFTFAVFLSTMLLPIEVTLLANVQTIRELQWTDTTQALVIPFAATAFGTFLIRQAFAGIPGEIRDAARLDGYGHVAFLLRFAIPLTRPVFASFTLIATLGAWGQYLWHRAVIDDPDKATLPIALRELTTTRVDESNLGAAGALLGAIPVVILLIAFQRHIVKGLTAGAVKG
jgi:sn-glycerol 3-phosphate transport system permease protein